MKMNRFAVYNWGVLVYNLGVILWGAYVRATGSGAGCGSHWPLCNGEIIPRTGRLETAIEFSHRLSSGLSLLLVIALFIWAFRAYSRGHLVRTGAGLSLFFIITEALLGAGLVLFQLVADNASVARALAMAVHLVNTFLLLGALTLTGWWASGGKSIKIKDQGAVGWLLGLGFLGMLVLGASGGITALGDTLFPAESVAEGLRQELSPTAHILIRLRLLHPIIAILVGIYLIAVAAVCHNLRPSPGTRRLSQLLTAVYLIQLVAGAINVKLLAPIWLQLVHLLLSDVVWIALVLLACTSLVEPMEKLAQAGQKQPQPALAGSNLEG
jgi:heme A synthase